MAEKIEMLGLRELESSLVRLPRELRKKTLYRALHDGARLVRDDARRRVTHVPSNLAKIFDSSKSSGTDANGRKMGRRKRSGARSAAELLRSRIVQQSLGRANYGFGYIPTGGRDTVVVRVSNRGYTRSGGKLRFIRPGSSPGWWWWLEFGTSRMPARPFLRPAFEARKFEAAREIKASLLRGIEAIAADLASRTALGRASFKAQAAAGL